MDNRHPLVSPVNILIEAKEFAECFIVFNTFKISCGLFAVAFFKRGDKRLRFCYKNNH